jgi:hypothetical protein
MALSNCRISIILFSKNWWILKMYPRCFGWRAEVWKGKFWRTPEGSVVSKLCLFCLYHVIGHRTSVTEWLLVAQETWDDHSSVFETSSLLVCYVLSLGDWIVTCLRTVVPSYWTVWYWRWRNYGPPKRTELPAQRYGVEFQKTRIFLREVSRKLEDTSLFW